MGERERGEREGGEGRWSELEGKVRVGERKEHGRVK